MKFKYLLLLFSVITLSQNKVLDVKINTITFKDLQIDKRKYTINYQIQNLTNHEISFFLIPNTLIANAASSMTLYPIYKLYINGENTRLDGPFFEKNGIDWETFIETNKNLTKTEFNLLVEKTVENYKQFNQNIINNYKKDNNTNVDDTWILENNNLIKSKITLNPNEIKQFEIQTHWNKERYYKQDDLEYFLNENDNYEFELTLHLLKKEFKDRLSTQELSIISKDKNFIEGIFTSNKFPIDFK